MTDETRLAFAHPSERAKATAGPGTLDRISLRDHIVAVEIGAFQAERGMTQRLSFNVVVEVLPLDGSAQDDVDRILSYDCLTEAIATELAAERLNLLETLAERVADRILTEPQAFRAFVRIEKLDRGAGALGVEIMRACESSLERPDVPSQNAPEPRLVFLSNEAMDAPFLTGWLDQLEALGDPLILCVGLAPDHVLQVADEGAQRQIDLLAIEQNAWRLTTRDARCVVVATKTELDWAMKNGQTSVWAPAKIVLDAVDPAPVAPHDTIALAAWFGTTLGAQDMWIIGASAPENAALPLRVIPMDNATL